MTKLTDYKFGRLERVTDLRTGDNITAWSSEFVNYTGLIVIYQDQNTGGHMVRFHCKAPRPFSLFGDFVAFITASLEISAGVLQLEEGGLTIEAKATHYMLALNGRDMDTEGENGPTRYTFTFGDYDLDQLDKDTLLYLTDLGPVPELHENKGAKDENN